MGEPVFDKARYPDPKGMVDDLHSNNFHLMISFWPYFRPGTKTYDDMENRDSLSRKRRWAVSIQPARPSTMLSTRQRESITGT